MRMNRVYLDTIKKFLTMETDKLTGGFMSYQIQTNKIISNREIAQDIYELKLESDTSWITHPDQFVSITIPRFSLKRPISICDYDDTTLTLVYAVVGEGTKILSNMSAGTELEVLTGCGNGFDLTKYENEILCVGGGLGAAPIHSVAKRAKEKGLKVTCVLGFRDEAHAYYLDEFKKLDVNLVVAYDSEQENVVTAMKKFELLNKPVACVGPLPMMKAVYRETNAYGQYSLEARMGCSFGACMGCSIQTASGHKRICKEGPVFESEDLLWED